MPRGKVTCGHREKVAIGQARREASGLANPADTLILDFEPPDHPKINVCYSATRSLVVCCGSHTMLQLTPFFRNNESIIALSSCFVAVEKLDAILIFVPLNVFHFSFGELGELFVFLAS